MTGLSLLESASASFREQRMHRFLRDFGITRDTRLLDVGGTLYNWTLAPVCPKITILNRVHCDAPHAAADWVLGDGCTLPFGDHSFDVVFSNSVIEHLGTLERQQAFAAEVARVGRRYFVANSEPLVSDRDSPVESLRALSPQALAGRHVRRWTVWAVLTGIVSERKNSYIEHYLADVRWLDGAALQALFPRATVVPERFLGLTKSVLAVLR